MKVVLSLASSSPRRRQLLTFGGWMFHVLPVDIDETPHENEKPLNYVKRMATEKAKAAEALMRAGGIALAADTTVVHEGKILGKPANPREAVDMLLALRGKTHQVHTAIAVIRKGDRKPKVDIATTDVPMRYYSDEEIFSYVGTGDPFDKAGGYAIQHNGFRPVSALDGCYANVVGLPMCHVTRLLEKFDILPRTDVPKACQETLEYHCPVYSKILPG